MGQYVFDQHYEVNGEKRRKLNGHNSFLVLFTGLSGSGKSTISGNLENVLYQKGCRTYSLDGDNLRKGLCNDLGFSFQDRKENLRRVGEIAKLLIDSGTITLAAFVAPFESSRKMICDIVGEQNYIEVYVNTSLEKCEERDVKGLYAKARRGELKDFTGISSVYESPKSPDVVVDTDDMTTEEAVQRILSVIEKKLPL